MDILWYHFYRILEIRYHFNHTVTCHLKHAIVGGIKLTEVSGIKNSLYLRILPAKLPDHITGAVSGIIINKYKLIVILGQLLLYNIGNCLADRACIFHFIITGNQYTDLFHRFLFSFSFFIIISMP